MEHAGHRALLTVEHVHVLSAPPLHQQKLQARAFSAPSSWLAWRCSAQSRPLHALQLCMGPGALQPGQLFLDIAFCGARATEPEFEEAQVVFLSAGIGTCSAQARIPTHGMFLTALFARPQGMKIWPMTRASRYDTWLITSSALAWTTAHL